MAQKVQVVLVDDLDGGPGDQTVTFSYQGVAYEIDLSDANAAKLADVLAPYIGHGRKVGGTARRGSARRSGGAGNSGKIREWAKAQGLEVNERGRISAELRAKYDAAHG